MIDSRRRLRKPFVIPPDEQHLQMLTCREMASAQEREYAPFPVAPDGSACHRHARACCACQGLLLPLEDVRETEPVEILLVELLRADSYGFSRVQ
jgi:hypothetical protein